MLFIGFIKNAKQSRLEICFQGGIFYAVVFLIKVSLPTIQSMEIRPSIVRIVINSYRRLHRIMVGQIIVFAPSIVMYLIG